MLSVYIHIPFCNNVCHYCNFYKMVVSDKLKTKTIDYIIKEINIKKDILKNVQNIYIGGGTPSFLPLNLLEMLFKTLLGAVEIKNVKEFTIEANPDDITEDFVSLISRYGVNRISIGVQSFNKKTIDFLGRIPYVKENEILDKISLLNKYGINNINLDLMYAIPNQTLDELIIDINTYVKFPITHISTYSFELCDKTILKHKFNNKEFDLISEEIDSNMYNAICTILKEHGFIHYETSNFSKPTFMGQYNLNCWKNLEYIGIGPAAASYYDNKRFANVSNLNEYFKMLDSFKFEYDYFEELTTKDIIEYELILGLRLLEGINIQDFISKYGKHPFDFYPTGEQLVLDGLLELDNNYLKIPSKHIYITNYILRRFLYE